MGFLCIDRLLWNPIMLDATKVQLLAMYEKSVSISFLRWNDIAFSEFAAAHELCAEVGDGVKG
jgi:hypothetical protein